MKTPDEILYEELIKEKVNINFITMYPNSKIWKIVTRSMNLYHQQMVNDQEEQADRNRQASLTRELYSRLFNSR